MTAPSIDSALAVHYARLWEESEPLVRGGRASLDSWLSSPAEDARRGVTLLARPAAKVVAPLSAFLDQLALLEPEQRFQPASDLHHTILSLFTATAEYAPYMARLADYLDAVSVVAASTPPFVLDVRGVTLTPGAVLAQGFPREETLATLRDKLRTELAARGLGADLDQRYRLVTAHLTLARFASPLREPERFVAALAAARHIEFGSTTVERLELVFGDWFHSAAHEQHLAEFPLR
jgi:2'-5' RNA ligase